MRKLFFLLVFPVLLFLVLVCSPPLVAANSRLYLKDGSFHIVREYQVEGDRVKFYSVERSDWEEIPAALVDLKRTEAEGVAQKATIDKRDREDAEEKEAAQAARAEIRKIPRDPGLYSLENDQLRIFQEIESTVHNAKGRNILKALSPVPLVPGKATLELTGEHSANAVKDNRPEFFFQLAEFESFALVKATPQKGVRVIENITIVPVTKELVEERSAVEIFQKQLSENGLYKIWPQEPLEKGEYAVVEYSEGKMNQKVWDFRIE